ncbi:phage tail tape measure protein [Kitasatospora sp. NPDC002227]|uniref:phage tail tape measure protein n=1 Tax=Kitasatospora sp. NPDC002227 TaxID=3154773 RepID=UPI00331E54FF
MSAKPIKITVLGDITELGKSLGEGLKKVDSFGKKVAGLALAGGGAIAAGLGDGLAEAMDRAKGNGLLAAQIGATPEQAKTLGQAAGRIFGDGLGESVEQINEGLKSLWQQGLVPAGATSAQIEKIGGKLLNVSKIMGEDLGPTANAAGQMVKTGLAKNFDEAMDVLVRGTQLGINKNEDLLDTFNEYSVQFKKVGMSAPVALGLMNQALRSGARDSDLAADAIKEFSLRAIDGSTGSAAAYKALGLSAKKMTETIAGGGPKAAEATQLVFDKMRALKDPVDKNTVAVGLFGTQAEDLGGALAAMNPATAVAGLGQVAGAAQKAGDTLNDNASTRLSAFGRKAKQYLVDLTANEVLPVLDKLSGKFRTVGDVLSAGADFVERYKTPIEATAGVIGVLMIPSLIAWGVSATTAGIANGVAWATSTASSVTGAVTQVASHWAVVGGWLKSGAQAVISAGLVVGGWIAMGAESLIQGARMAAAWLIAMGPVGIIIAIVVALAALIWANWDKVKTWTVEAWDYVWDKIKGVFNFLKDLFMNFTGVGLLIKHWDTIKRATMDAFLAVGRFAQEGIDGVVSFFTGLPGRIVAAAGRVKDAALGIGRMVIDGISDGLSKLGGLASDLTSTVANAAKGAINHVIDLLNWAIPDRLGWGALSIDLPANPIPKIRAMGGPASGLTRVGERGPELVNLPRGSTVIPNHAAGVGGVVVNVQSQADPFVIGREVAWALRVAPR